MADPRATGFSTNRQPSDTRLAPIILLSMLLALISFQPHQVAAAGTEARVAMLTDGPTTDDRPRWSRSTLQALAEQTARRFGVDAALVHAVIIAESAYRPNALSPKDAMGLMQLIPATARRYAVADPWDPAQNIEGGVRYLRDLLRLFDGDLTLTAAAYNAGENAVIRYGNQVPPYRETETYVTRVLHYHGQLAGGTPIAKLKHAHRGATARLSGWGIIFGSFFEAQEARGVIAERRKTLKPVLRKGRTAVVERQRDIGRRYRRPAGRPRQGRGRPGLQVPMDDRRLLPGPDPRRAEGSQGALAIAEAAATFFDWRTLFAG